METKAVRCAALLIVALAGLPGTLLAQEVDTVRVGSPALRGARVAVGEHAIESFARAAG